MNILEHNRTAWNRQSSEGSEWARPVDSGVIRDAKSGRWEVNLTPNRPVPRDWFGEIQDKRLLCLASGGGQQAPVLAAAGAQVVSFDLSDEQLEKDRLVSARDDLDVRCVQGNMMDLSEFLASEFDLIFHPVSNVFVPELEPVWSECYRVLKPGGRLLAGFMNPSFFLFNHEADDELEKLVVKYKLPYIEPDSLSIDGLVALKKSGRPLEFSHSIEAQVGGQLSVGFVLRGIYEDDWNDEATPLNRFSPTYIATWAEKSDF
jgi:SAM-dependent methyltransferase